MSVSFFRRPMSSSSTLAGFFHGEPPLSKSEFPAGWAALLTEMFINIDRVFDDSTAKRFWVVQFKEIDAGLRIEWYLNRSSNLVMDRLEARPKRGNSLDRRQRGGAHSFISERVDKATALAAKTCHVCGERGTSWAWIGWSRTVCQTCRRMVRKMIASRNLEFAKGRA